MPISNSQKAVHTTWSLVMQMDEQMEEKQS
jgi:hypothetical protein